MNRFAYAYDAPTMLIDFWGLTAQDIKDMTNLARQTQGDLRDPGNVKSGNLNWMGPDVLGFTNPVTKRITVDDRWLDVLSCDQLFDLFELIIHETIHRTRPRRDMIRRPRNHPDIYDEAAARADPYRGSIKSLCEGSCSAL